MRILIFAAVFALVWLLSDVIIRKYSGVKKTKGAKKPVNLPHFLVLSIVSLLWTFIVLFMIDSTTTEYPDLLFGFSVAIYIFVICMVTGLFEKKHLQDSKEYVVTFLNGLTLTFITILSTTLGLFSYIWV